MASKLEINYSYEDCPTLWRFAQSRKRIRGVRGSVGSGKSSAMVIEIARMGMEQVKNPLDGIRYTKYAVIRNCYDDKTEILTEKNGWKLFKDLLPDDSVATLQDDKLVYTLPDGVSKFPYKGDMVGFESENIDFLVTPDHKMWVSKRTTRKKIWGKYEVDTAQNIYGSQTVRVKKDAKWEGKDSNHSNDFFKLLGMWFADGSYGLYSYPYKNKTERIVITQAKQDGIKYIKNLLDKLEFKYSETKKRNALDFLLLQTNCKLYNDFKSFIEFSGKSIYRKIPDSILCLSSEKLEAFLDGFSMGDGCIDCNGVTKLFTSSKVLADQLQEIIFKIGRCSNLHTHKNPETCIVEGRVVNINTENCYTLTILNEDRHEPVLHVNPKHTNKLHGWYKQQYDGFVYCVEMELVPVYVRRNGKTFWCMRTYRQLKDTTIPKFFEWFPEKYFGRYKTTDRDYFITAFPDCIIEINFRALDRPQDIANLLSWEITGAWINEAREIEKPVFDMLDTRIGRFPSEKDGGCTYPCIIMDTNSPDETSWWHELFNTDMPFGKPKPDNIAEFIQPSARSEFAENKKHLREDYYEEIVKGKDEDWLKVYIDNEYGFIKEGDPIYEGKYLDSVHTSQVELAPVRGRDIIVSLDFGLCYSDDTEVLTNSGWKLFKNVDETKDKVATLNPEKFNLEYTLPNFKVEYDYNGDLIEFSGQNFNFMVTPEHRVPFTNRGTPNILRFDSAENLSKQTSSHHFIQLNSEWNGSKFSILGLPENISAGFLGWYLSEGNCSKTGNGINITQVKDNVELRDLLEDNSWECIGITWKRYRNVWRTSNKELHEYLKVFGHAEDKYVPNELKNANSEIIDNFLYTYLMGDGHIRSRTKINSGIGRKQTYEKTIATISTKMKDDLQELALKAGYSSGSRIQKSRASYMPDGRMIKGRDIWIVTLKSINRAEVLPEHIHIRKYKGKIYCLNVPYHTLYVRRNGKTCWNGNTPSALIGQHTPMGYLNILEEYVSKDMGIKRFANNILKPTLALKYRDYNIIITGDPAGNNREQNDETTCYEILRSIFPALTVNPALTNSPIARIEAVEYFLMNYVDLGKPSLQINSSCITLRKGFAGGYVKDKLGSPKKNKWCVDFETEILTINGWKKYNEVNVGETAYGYNLQKQGMEETKINDVYIDYGEHDVINFKNKNGVDFLYTPEHKCIVSHRNTKKNEWSNLFLLEADNVNKAHSFISVPKINKDLTKSYKYTDWFISLCAWVATEGSYRKDGSIIISQSVKHNPEYVKYLDSILLGHPCLKSRLLTKSGNMVTWRIVAELSSLIKETMPDKCPTPSFVIDMTNPQKRLFLYECIRGDGTYGRGKYGYMENKNKINRNRDFWLDRKVTPRFMNKKKSFVDTLQMLCFLIGINCRLKIKKHWTGCKFYCLNLLRDKNNISIGNMQQSTKRVSGIWCPNTGLSTWVMRRNGIVCITGNSHIHDAMQYLAMYIMESVNRLSKAQARPRKTQIYHAPTRAGL